MSNYGAAILVTGTGDQDAADNMLGFLAEHGFDTDTDSVLDSGQFGVAAVKVTDTKAEARDAAWGILPVLLGDSDRLAELVPDDDSLDVEAFVMQRKPDDEQGDALPAPPSEVAV